ncbi:hypothetical protein Tco_0023993 [Tanacetum coccineum]
MGDANPIHTLGDYFKPSHEGYRNTIELLVGNNVMAIDYATGERLRKLRPGEAWAIIKKLAQYEDEGWKDLVDPNEGSLDHENPDIKQLLGIMERKVDTLIKDAISLMRRGESVFRMTEERVMQLEEYMKVITGEFMQLSSELMRLKDKIREEGSRMRKIKKITKYPDMEVPEPLAEHKFLETPAKKTFPDALKSIPMNLLWIRCHIHSRDIIDWEFLTNQGFAQAFFESIKKTLSLAPNRYDPNHMGVRENETLSRLRKGVTVKANHLLLGFWPIIRDDGFNVGNTEVAAIRDPRLHNGECFWPAAQEVVEEDDEGDEAAGGMQVMKGLEVPPTCTQDERAYWMYDTVRQFQYLSTHDNLDPHLQINPFLGCEADYPPIAYQGYMPLGYEYRPGPSQDNS